MKDQTAAPAARFQAQIYRELDRKLKATDWNSGASEAHGLLSALACRSVPAAALTAKAWLFQLTQKADLELLEGIYELILRDLGAEGFQFNLLLAGDDFTAAERAASLADWCGGFMQGFFHDRDEGTLAAAPARVRESVHDIMTISGVDIGVEDGEDAARQLVEIEEYLRVAVQVIFDELNPPSSAAGLN